MKEAGKSAGLRINPECSTQEGHAIYDPCAPGSRMGTTRAQWETAVRKHPELIGLLDGIHFHTLCEQDSSDLETTLAAVKVKFGDLISQVKWLNLGGGHHITRPGYDIARLEKCISAAKEEWKVDVYLEPGEAWALNAGFFFDNCFWMCCKMVIPSLQFWMEVLPVICRMFWKCLIVLLFLEQMNREKMQSQSGSEDQPACQEIS